MDFLTNERILSLLKITIFINLLIFFLLLGFNIGNGTITYKLFKSNNISTDCRNISLEETVECLNNDFNSWFEYNISNIRNKLSEEDFKEQGGVCSHAAEWYIAKAKELGFFAKPITFFGSAYIGHELALIYDKDINMYCIVDQTDYHCKKLGGLNAQKKI